MRLVVCGSREEKGCLKNSRGLLHLLHLLVVTDNMINPYDFFITPVQFYQIDELPEDLLSRVRSFPKRKERPTLRSHTFQKFPRHQLDSRWWEKPRRTRNHIYRVSFIQKIPNQFCSCACFLSTSRTTASIFSQKKCSWLHL